METKTQNRFTSDNLLPDIMTNSLLRDAEIVRLSNTGLKGSEIGRRLGLTRARISQVLKRNRIRPTSFKESRLCAFCQRPFLAYRSQPRKFCSRACSGISTVRAAEKACEVCSKPVIRQASKKSRRTFCSRECYHSVRQDGRYRQNRQGQRRARAIVSKCFPLEPQHVVHHEDRDNTNNSLPNLRVFASQADHMAYHHGSGVQPIWDGRAHV